jgi:hypothetical protein
MATSPTQLTLKHMRAQGYTCAIVEYWGAFDHKRHDLFGFIDVLCLRGDETVAIQTTSYANVGARVKKATNHENIPAVRKAGWTILVHGWRKNKSNRWELAKCVDLS